MFKHRSGINYSDNYDPGAIKVKTREIRAAGLKGVPPQGGWSRELEQADCIHTLIVVAWLKKGAFDIVQPDVTKVGGISESRRIAWVCPWTRMRWPGTPVVS
jgi:hypothetical protein